jgi:hypothetical protein
MREKRLDIATNVNYATGPTTGQPTKIAPPLSFAGDGMVPGLAFGAQWENYIQHYLQRQIEVSAIVPFRNWQEYPGVGSTAGILGATVRTAYNKLVGLTYFARGLSSVNPVFSVPPAAGSTSLPTYTITPGAGTFLCKGVAAVEDAANPGWIFVGSNSTTPTKTVHEWASSTAEITMPVSGSIELICKDKATGYFYAFAADTNRSVLVRGPNMASTWSVLGQRGAGAPAPTASMACAAANGLLILGYTVTPGSTQATVERMPTGAFSRTVHTPFADTSAVLDTIYSPQRGEFLFLTRGGTYRFTDPTASVEYVAAGFLTAAQSPVNGVVAGCLHETGAAIVGDNRMIVQPWLGDPSHAFQFDDAGPPSSNHRISFDGSALWLMHSTSSTLRLYRSLRSN